jgi:hypothetical protein
MVRTSLGGLHWGCQRELSFAWFSTITYPVALYGDDGNAKVFSCWDQYLATVFAQLTHPLFPIREGSALRSRRTAMKKRHVLRCASPMPSSKAV